MAAIFQDGHHQELVRQHAKREAYPQSYGVRRLPQIQKPAPLLTGVGFKVERRGK